MLPTNPIEEGGFQLLFAAAADAMLVIDAFGNVVAMNPEAERIFGWTQADLLGKPFAGLIPSRFKNMIESSRMRASGSPDSSREVSSVTLFARQRDGTEFPVEFIRTPLGPERDTPILVTIRDLSKWRRSQETLFREKEQALVTLSSIADAVITTDLAETITYMNPTAERLTGWRWNEAQGQPLSTVLTLFDEKTRKPYESIPAKCLDEGRSVDLAEGVLLLRRDGTEVAIGDSAAPLRDRNGATNGVVLVFHDITEKRRTTRKLSHESTHDALTGLVNRAEFERRLSRLQMDASSRPEEKEEHALCFLDLDKFKVVNDSCGHEAGDALLKSISSLLVDRLRNRDTIGRIGGDEFCILLEHCSSPKAEEITGNLRQSIKDFRFTWGDRSFSISASIGVIMITAESGRTADVMRAADVACYHAKEGGGDQVHLGSQVTPEILQRVEDRRIARLTHAMEKGSFQLFAQTIVPLTPQQERQARCEILLRMPDGRGGVEVPDMFLSSPERRRLLPAIDRWVIRKTIESLASWHRDHIDAALPLCAINLSVSSLDDESLIPSVRRHLAEADLSPEALCFEVAETAALGNFSQVVRLISQIRALGCGIGLDNFGSGLTSLAHLKALPVDFVKIGGHYVRGVANDPVYGTLVRAVNEVGRIMGITTIADEVEDDSTLRLLQDLGVQYAQGYAIDAPTSLLSDEGKVVFNCVTRSE